MKVALIILLLLSSAFVLALLLIVGVIVAGQWRDFDDLRNDEEDKQ